MLKFSSNRQKEILGFFVLTAALACATVTSAADRKLNMARMPLGASAPAPTGFLDFCRRSPADCAQPGDARADLKEISARASSLYWAGVFGSNGGAQPAAQPAAMGSAPAYDWSRVFPQRVVMTAQVRPVADPMKEGAAVSMEDLARPAVEVAAVTQAPFADEAVTYGAPVVSMAVTYDAATYDTPTYQVADTPAPAPMIARTNWALAAGDFGRDVNARIAPARPRLLDVPKQPFAAPLTPRIAPPVAPPVVVMGTDDWKLVAQVNRTLNRTIRYSTDERQHGVPDYWDVPTGPNPRGDCDDYVLAKRRALVEAGFPARALSIAIVETRLGESHAVLLVSTDTGEFVLDNQTSRILRWDRAGYKWHERQVPGSSFEWVRMGV